MFDVIVGQKSFKHLEISDVAIKRFSGIFFASHLVVKMGVAHNFIAQQTVIRWFACIFLSINEYFSNPTTLVPRDCNMDPCVERYSAVKLSQILGVSFGN